MKESESFQDIGAQPGTEVIHLEKPYNNEPQNVPSALEILALKDNSDHTEQTAPKKVALTKLEEKHIQSLYRQLTHIEQLMSDKEWTTAHKLEYMLSQQAKINTMLFEYSKR